MVEKWAGRLIPVLSSAVGAGLNYYFVRVWGERAQRHFREKHMRARRLGEYGKIHNVQRQRIRDAVAGD